MVCFVVMNRFSIPILTLTLTLGWTKTSLTFLKSYSLRRLATLVRTRFVELQPRISICQSSCPASNKPLQRRVISAVPALRLRAPLKRWRHHQHCTIRKLDDRGVHPSYAYSAAPRRNGRTVLCSLGHSRLSNQTQESPLPIYLSWWGAKDRDKVLGEN